MKVLLKKKQMQKNHWKQAHFAVWWIINLRLRGTIAETFCFAKERSGRAEQKKKYNPRAENVYSNLFEINMFCFTWSYLDVFNIHIVEDNVPIDG